MSTYAHWTIDAVEEMPKVAGERYEIIDGELFVLKTGDELTSPLLPGFACIIDRFFEL